MDVTELPLNRMLGMKRCNDQQQALLEMDESAALLNHLGAVHAAAQFALAEACSGECLLRAFGGDVTQVLPVVRRAEVKYKRPAQGKLFARAAVSDDEMAKFQTDLREKNRALVTVSVEVFDRDHTVTLTASFEWFVQARRTLSP